MIITVLHVVDCCTHAEMSHVHVIYHTCRATSVCAENYANLSKWASQERYAIFIYAFQHFMHYNVKIYVV